MIPMRSQFTLQYWQDGAYLVEIIRKQLGLESESRHE